MKPNDKLNYLRKLFQRVAIFYFGLIWVELIIIIFSDYNTFGQTFYENYGMNGLAFYMGTFLIVSIFFLWASKKLNEIENDLQK